MFFAKKEHPVFLGSQTFSFSFFYLGLLFDFKVKFGPQPSYKDCSYKEIVYACSIIELVTIYKALN